MFSFKRFFFLAFILFLLASAQRWLGFNLPLSSADLLFVFVLLLVFFLQSPFEYLALSAFGALLLQSAPGLDQVSVLVFILFSLALLLKQRILDKTIFSALILIALMSSALLLLLSPDLFFSSIFILRLLYNEMVALIFFFTLKKFEAKL